jgi:hypothetical protein
MVLSSAKIIATTAMLLTVQDSGTAPPPADALQERANMLAARHNSKVSMELNGCMKDERNSTAITCYYTLVNSIPVEVHALAPNSPANRVIVELSGAKQDAMVGTAFFLADLLNQRCRPPTCWRSKTRPSAIWLVRSPAAASSLDRMFSTTRPPAARPR